MFCTSIRKRPEWASVPNLLLSQKDCKWQESELSAHDLAIPLPCHGKQDFFRAILLSAKEMKDSEACMARIERLDHLTGGKNVGILFLVNDGNGKENGTRNLMELQICLMPNLEIPIIPLHSTSGIHTALLAYQKQALNTLRALSSKCIDPVTELLPYCSNNAPIPEHATNVLSDVCQSLPQLAQAATTEEGQAVLRSWLDDSSQGVEGIARDIIDFWGQEFLVD